MAFNAHTSVWQGNPSLTMNKVFLIIVTVVVLLALIAAASLAVYLRRRNDVWAFRITVFLLFAIGLALAFVQIPYVNHDFAHSLGDALIISSVLAVSVDLYLKERVLREVSSDVSKYLVGYRLPEEVQNRIRSLLQTRWIKRNCEIRLRLTQLNNGRVKIEIFVSRLVENITMEGAVFQDKFSYERHLPQNLLEMRCDSPDVNAQYQLEGLALDSGKKEKADEPGVMEAVGKVVRIPPVHETVGRYYRFAIRYEGEYPANSSDIFAFDLPTIDVVVEAECPEGFRITLPPADVATPNRWEYCRLFLPGEHIRYRWERNANLAQPANGGEERI